MCEREQLIKVYVIVIFRKSSYDLLSVTFEVCRSEANGVKIYVYRIKRRL